MHVEVTEDWAERFRQRALLGRLDLAGVLAQDGWDPRQPERLVDLRFRLARDDLAPSDLGQRVLVQRPSSLKRALTEFDIVPLRAREIELRRVLARPGRDRRAGWIAPAG